MVEHQAVGDYGEVVALELHVGDTDGDGVVFLGHVAANEAIGTLVFQEDGGVVITDGALEQALGIVWRCGGDYLEAGCVAEEGLGALGVVEPAADATALRGAQDERNVELSGGAVPYAGRLADNLVDRGPNEVGELDFGDGAHSVHRSAEGDSGY